MKFKQYWQEIVNFAKASALVVNALQPSGCLDFNSFDQLTLPSEYISLQKEFICFPFQFIGNSQPDF